MKLQHALFAVAATLAIGSSRATAGEFVETGDPSVTGEFIVILTAPTETPDFVASGLSVSARSLLPVTGRNSRLAAGGPKFASRFLHVRGASTAEARRWATRPDVAKVIPNVLGRASGLRIHNSPSAIGTGVDRIDQRDPRSAGTGVGYYADPWTGRGVDVWLIDDSVRTTHQDFANGGGWSRTVQNVYDATEGACPTYETSHGTQMASMIAGRVGGVARDANIKAVDIICGGGTIQLDDALRAIEFVRFNFSFSVVVVNMSWEFSTQAAMEAILPAMSDFYSDGDNPIFIAAAGNGATQASDIAPAASDVALAVGNISAAGTTDLWISTSNYGSKVGILAPGAGIVAADATSNTSYSSYGDGTSASAAHVSGVAARLVEKYGPSWGGGAAFQGLVVANATTASVSGLPVGTTNKVLFSDFESPPQSRAHGLASSSADTIRRVVTVGSTGNSVVGGEYQRQNTSYPCLTGTGSLGLVELRTGNGTVVWNRTLGWSCAENYVVGVGTDQAGDVYAVMQTRYSSMNQAYFTVYKLSGGSGTTVWSQSVGSAYTYAADLAVFEQGSSPIIVVVGHTYDIISGLPVIGGWDAFALGYSSSGSTQFMRSVGSVADDYATSAAATATWGYVGGVSYGVLPSATNLTGGSVTSNLGGADAFVVRLSLSNGTIQQTAQFGTSGTEAEIGLGRYASGFVAVVGSTTGILASSSVGPGGGSDIFVAHLNPTTLISSWLRQFGSTGNEASPSVATVTSSEEVWVAASTSGSLLSSANATDSIVANFSANGRFHWGEQSAAQSNDSASCIAISPVGTSAENVDVLVGGSTSNTWPVGTFGGSTDGYLRALRGL